MYDQVKLGFRVDIVKNLLSSANSQFDLITSVLLYFGQPLMLNLKVRGKRQKFGRGSFRGHLNFELKSGYDFPLVLELKIKLLLDSNHLLDTTHRAAFGSTLLGCGRLQR